jgi:hypothetical protein
VKLANNYVLPVHLELHMEADIEILVKKYALQNAVKYGKPPQQGAVMGKLMGEQPELRQKYHNTIISINILSFFMLLLAAV